MDEMRYLSASNSADGELGCVRLPWGDFKSQGPGHASFYVCQNLQGWDLFF